MSLTILVRKSTARPRFTPHYNIALDKFVSTSQEYVSELKKRGLEPYNPSAVRVPEQKPYTPSRWARAMIDTIKSTKRADGTFRPGDRFKAELAKRGVSLDHPVLSPHLPAHYRKDMPGGFA